MGKIKDNSKLDKALAAKRRVILIKLCLPKSLNLNWKKEECQSISIFCNDSKFVFLCVCASVAGL